MAFDITAKVVEADASTRRVPCHKRPSGWEIHVTFIPQKPLRIDQGGPADHAVEILTRLMFRALGREGENSADVRPNSD